MPGLAKAHQADRVRPSADEVTDPLMQSQKILDAQLKGLEEVLSPELQQSLSTSQQSWVAHRDQQCAFELRPGGGAAPRHRNGRPRRRLPRPLQPAAPATASADHEHADGDAGPSDLLNEGMNSGTYLPAWPTC